jgi:hypothetical protein
MIPEERNGSLAATRLAKPHFTLGRGHGVPRHRDQALRFSLMLRLSGGLSTVIVMVPMMVVAIYRAVRPPVVMIPGVNAKDTVHATCSTANGTADGSANRTGGPASLRSAPLHSSENALSITRGRDRKERRDNGIF